MRPVVCAHDRLAHPHRVSSLATDMSTKLSSIEAKIDRYLGHLARYPGSKVGFHASDMVYCTVFSDVSHNSVSKGRSRAGGLGYFGWTDDPQRLNGAVFTMSTILDVVTSSAGEGEYGAAYMVARQTVWMRAIARALGHPQGPTTIYCNNTCAVGPQDGQDQVHRPSHPLAPRPYPPATIQRSVGADDWSIGDLDW